MLSSDDRFIDHDELRPTKAKAYNTHIAPQTAYRSCSGSFCVTDRAGVQPIGRKLCLRPQTLAYDQTAMRSPGLPFNGPHPRNSWITAHLPTPEGWKAEFAWLVIMKVRSTRVVKKYYSSIPRVIEYSLQPYWKHCNGGWMLVDEMLVAPSLETDCTAVSMIMRISKTIS